MLAASAGLNPRALEGLYSPMDWFPTEVPNASFAVVTALSCTRCALAGHGCAKKGIKKGYAARWSFPDALPAMSPK